MTVLTDTAVHRPSARATAASEALLRIEAVSRQYGLTAWGIRDVSLQLRPGILGRKRSGG